MLIELHTERQIDEIRGSAFRVLLFRLVMFAEVFKDHSLDFFSPRSGPSLIASRVSSQRESLKGDDDAESKT